MSTEDLGGRDPEGAFDDESRFLSLHAEYGSEVISVMGPDNTLLYESASIERMLGYRHAEEVSAAGDWFRYVHPEDMHRLGEAVAGCMATPGESPPVEFRIKDADGYWRWLESRGINLLDDPRVRGVVVSTHEITERKRAEGAQKESEERLVSAFENAPIGVALVGVEGRFLRVNHALCGMFGYTETELLSLGSYDVTHSEDHAASREWMARQERVDERHSTIELRFVRKDGSILWALVSAALVTETTGEPSHWVCHYQDITGRKALEKRLEHQALYDPLTGLPGRALLTDRLSNVLSRTGGEGPERSGGSEGSVAVLFVDVDNLKLVNDSLGHGAGDRLLRIVGERLGRCVREQDTVARIGGDEFVILVESSVESPSAAENAPLVAGRILEELEDPVYVDYYEVPIVVSVGIAVDGSNDSPAVGPGAESAEELIRHADAAMYRAKSAGGGAYSVYDPAMDRADLERLELSSALQRAIERGELRAHYQHKIELATGEIAGWEALLRWEHPEHGMISPERFIPLAEETGLIVPIGRWILGEACSQARLWRERYTREPGQFMSVNLSAKQFSDRDLADGIGQALRQSGLPAEALDLEITERVLLEEESSNFSRIRELKELGVSFSLDDFGTGYSSMRSLKRLPMDSLKIDRSFVGGLPGDPEDEAFVTAMVSLARALGLSVVAEGIETSEQWTRLRELGCDYGQGYYFAPPLPPEEASHYWESGFSTE